MKKQSIPVEIRASRKRKTAREEMVKILLALVGLAEVATIWIIITALCGGVGA